jgi:FG-GAP-like repeat
VGRIPRWAWLAVGVVVVVAIGAWLLLGRTGKQQTVDMEAVRRDALSEASTAQVRTACSTCHVFPQPDILPRDYWPVAVRGMFQIAARRGITIPVSVDRAMAWYVFQAPEQLPAAPGRTDAGPGPLRWSREPWHPEDVSPEAGQRPAVTHVQMASLLGGSGLDVLVSDVSTNRVYALRPYEPNQKAVVIGSVPNPGRLAVTDLDRDGRTDLLVAALGQLAPTNDPVGSVVWFRRTGPQSFQPVVLADSLGRVADVQAADLNGDGRTDLLVAVFGWMQNGELLWLENTGSGPDHPSFVRHILDSRSGFTDVRAADLNHDGRLDVVALIAQEFQQVMVYWGEDGGYRPETVYQAPNPDWGYTGLEVADFTGNGYPDLIVTNGDNLDLTVAKPFHGVGLLENLGDGRFEYRHITSMYGAHRAVPVDLSGDGLPGLLVSAWLPPTVVERAPAPREALIWLERVGPTQLVRRVLKSDGVDHMTMAVGDATGDGRPDIALGSMDLGVVDPAQAHRGPPLTSWVTLWRNLGATRPSPRPGDAQVIDWRATPANQRQP